MARAKKRTPRKKTRRTTKVRQKPVAKKRRAAKKRVARKIPRRKATRVTRPRRAAARKKTKRRAPRPRRTRREASLEAPPALHGLGPDSAGQSGDIQGLPEAEIADSESVEELAEEGQAFEAELIDAVENAPEGEVKTREVPEDDVPDEYLDED
jgi:hypothetical protein